MREPGQAMAIAINNRIKAKVEQGELFPGFQLKKKFNTIQEGACWIGNFFERASYQMLGGSYCITDSNFELNPDLIHEQNNWVVESKSCVAGSRWLIGQEQLRRYVQHYRQTGTICYYALWTYAHRKPIATTKSAGECMKAVSQSIQHLYLMDVRILEAMRLKPPEGVQERLATMRFIGRETFVRPYMTIRPATFLNLLQDPKAFVEGIGLKFEDFDFKSRTARPRKVKMDGIPFFTNQFRYTRLEEAIPF